jgi:hypothetical protein
MPIKWRIDDILNTVRVLLQAGFQRTSQLACVVDNAWGTKDTNVLNVIHKVIEHVTVELRDAESKKDMWSAIEHMLKSGGDLEPQTMRPQNLGPTRAVAAAGIADWSPETKRQKLNNASMNAVVDSVVGGRKSYISGARGYLHFMRDLHPRRMPLPPQVDDLALWATFFKNSGTFSNYCSAIKWLTEGCGLCTDVFSDPILRRVKTSLKNVTKPRERGWIGGDLTQQLMRAAVNNGDVRSAMLFGAAYVFLARVPSELLPWQVGGTQLTDARGGLFAAAVQVGDDEVRVHLQTRKNARHGDTIRRLCACNKAPALCPVHTLGPWLKAFPIGHKPFEGLTAAAATKLLRKYLGECGIENVAVYSLHSFRRGCAQDLCDFGATLQDLLSAGGWNSRACFTYLRPQDMNLKAIAKFIAEDSDSDGEN